MTTLAIISIAGGVILGLRLQYLFLILAVAAASAAIAGFAIMHQSGIGRAMLEIVLAGAALQIGYLCGAAARSVIAAPIANLIASKDPS
jgi:hypothetical protein